MYMIKNGFIARNIQKGFLFGISGCIEHTFALFEALRDAKQSYRQIVITWLDLANAYGSVRHNLIQFALNWYHVPKDIQQLIFDYYEKLAAMIITNEWSTGFFLFDIGLFQGCVLSTILFNCVFQLLLDFLQPQKMLGYKFKNPSQVSTFTKAYADDLTLLTCNAADNQFALNLTNFWLQWTQTMKVKPRTCVSLGLKVFHKDSQSEKFIPVKNTSYSPFNPNLTIDGQNIQFILDPSQEDPFKASHFKFLGRWIHPLAKEKHIKIKIRASFTEKMSRINESLVNGYMKLWLYQFYALAHLSWPFIVFELDRTFALDLQKEHNCQFKNGHALDAL